MRTGRASEPRSVFAALICAVSIVDAEELGGTMIEKLAALFDEDATEALSRAAVVV